MKKMLIAISAIGALTLASCTKNVDNNTGSGGLTQGKSTITFNSNGNFGSGTSYSPTSVGVNSATRQSTTGYDVITLQTNDINGINVRTAGLQIFVANGASTTNGAIEADFSLPNGAISMPVLSLSNSAGGANAVAFGSESGKLTITKLTDTEIEGTFNGTVTDGLTTPSTLVLTNGKFAGKF